MAEMVSIACRLPSGIIFHYPSDDEKERLDHSKQIYLRGANQSSRYEEYTPKERLEIKLSPRDFGITQIPKEIWERLQKVHGKDFAPFKSHAIFEVKSEKDAKDKMRDLVDSKMKTGLEPCDLEAEKISPYKAE